MKIAFVQKFGGGIGVIPEWKKAHPEQTPKKCNPSVLLLMAFWTILLATIFFLTSTLLYKPAAHVIHNNHNKAPSSLRFVQIVFRHGRRTPIKLFLDDPNNILWGNISGQLTKEGKQDAYELGKWFRQRYNGFISQLTKDKQVMLKSTDFDRTLESAQLFAAGLFPPTHEEVWNSDVGSDWQPYPVHPSKFKSTLSDEIGCIRKDQLAQMLTATAGAKRVRSENKALIDRVMKGLEKSASIGNVFDIIMIEEANNLTFPDWISKDIPQLKKFQSLYNQDIGKNKDIVRLGCGDIIESMINELMNAIENKTFNMKVNALSGHDITLTCLMSTLNVFNSIWPPFSSALIIELHENDYNQHYIKVLYRNETINNVPYDLSPSVCGKLCTLEHIKNLTMPYFVDDITKECAPLNHDEYEAKQAEIDLMFP